MAGGAGLFFALSLCFLAPGEEIDMMSASEHEPIVWLSTPAPDAFVESAHLSVGTEGRALTTEVFGEVYFDVALTDAQAAQCAFVYLLLDLPSPAQIELFYRLEGGEGFDNAHFALGSKPTFLPGPRAYRIDMRNLPGWRGNLKALRVRLGGLMSGATIGYGGIAATARPLDALPGKPGWPVAPIAAGPPYRGERFATCSRTVVSMDEVTAAAGLSTYIANPKDSNPYGLNFDPQSQFSLVQFQPGIGQAEVSPSVAVSVEVTPEPGTLKATLDFPGGMIEVQATPLRELSDTAEAEGAVLYRIQSRNGAPVWVDCGQMAPMTVWERGAWLRTGVTKGVPCTVTVERGGAIAIRHPEVPCVVVLRPGPGAEPVTLSRDGTTGRIDFPGGAGWLVAGFAADADRALALTRGDPVPMESASLDYFRRVLDHFRIETPNPVIDEAFRTAWLTMDYTWVKPYGCMESLHHWWAIWQQYPSASFEWAGLTDRSRENILEHARRQYKSGNIPYLLFFGERHSDFGGNNQTFMWQVQHYLETTGDTELAREVLPVIRRLVDAFWRYEDLDDNGVPSFGVQVLTQEDYIASPRDAVSPAAVGVEMWRTLALLERLSGNGKEAEAAERKAAEAAVRWRKSLWMDDLGRPAYFVDDLGERRLEGPYHTFVLPVVLGLLDPLDAYTTARHLRDRLMGASGELYYSNLFPNHISGVRSSPYGPTWGMQAGAYMQPWATRLFNAIGAPDAAIGPLETVARWATMFPHLDAWPESSTEFTPAYFSNTAASYAQTVIESLFGLRLDRTENLLRVQPGFPGDWDQARIQLGPVRACYRRTGQVYEYRITTDEPLRRELRWPLPVGAITSVEVDGEAAEYTTEPAVGGMWLCLATEARRETRFRFRAEPVTWRVDHARSLAEGEVMDLRVSGGEVMGVEDPCGVTRGVDQSGKTVRVRLAEGLLDEAMRYGRLGQLNFSRRTFFLRCRAGDQTFWAPIDFALLPRVEAAPANDLEGSEGRWALRLTVRNNTLSPLRGTGVTRWAGRERPLSINVPARGEQEIAIETPTEALVALSPGENPLRLVLPGGTGLDLACPVIAPFLKQGGAFVPVPIPEEQLVSDEGWKDFAAFPVFWQGPYNGFPPPMDALRGRTKVTCDRTPGVVFPLDEAGRFALASRKAGRNAITVPVDESFRKIYLLVLPLVENHDMFTQCGLVRVTCKADFDRPPFDPREEPVQWTRARYDKIVIQRPLYTPGDLDSWMPEQYAGPMATARQGRDAPHGLLDRLSENDGDWAEGVPLASPYGMFAMFQAPPRNGWPEGAFRSFPQPQYWASCPEIRTDSAVFNVVEVDLGRSRHVESIELICPLQDAALGLVSVVGLR